MLGMFAVRYWQCMWIVGPSTVIPYNIAHMSDYIILGRINKLKVTIIISD